VADLALLLLTLLWGTTFTVVNRVLQHVSPGLFLTARFATAAAVLGAVALWRRDRLGPRFWRHGGLMGAFMGAGFLLQTSGLGYTTPARSGFLTGLAVLIVPFVARFALGRKVRVSAWVGVGLAVAGMLVLSRLFGEELADTVRLGDALSAGCAVAFALQIVFTAEWAPRHPLVPLTLVQVGITLAAAVVLLGAEPVRHDPARAGAFAAAVAFTGVLMTAGAFFVQNWGQRHTTAVRAALIFSLEPVAAALFSHYYGGEPLGVADWVGGGLIALGVVAGEVGGALEARIEGLPAQVGEPPA
jgi:drug/metabolite transporter (DMT)-like permease